MNLKAFGTFVLCFGIGLSLLGGGIMIANRPLSPSNLDNERARGDGLKMLITGMILNVLGIAVELASIKRKPMTSFQSVDRPGTVPRTMPAVDLGEQPQDTDSQPLPKCPKCGAPTFDMRNHRCRASVPDRNY